MKKQIPFRKLLSGDICSFEGVLLELLDGTQVKTSPVVGYSGYNGIHKIETKNTIYYSV